MKKLFTCTAVSLTISLIMAASALALLPNHDYSVSMSTLSADNQQTQIEVMATTSDANGKLSFQFTNVPDTSTAPFLMVEISDMASGQPLVVRQNLIPAPNAGQALKMGMNQTNHRQTQAAMQAIAETGRVDALHAMFPVTMISGGAISADDASDFGMMTNLASSAFETAMTDAGVTATQMTDFSNGISSAMHDLAANNMQAVDTIDPVTATGMQGRASGLFMQAMVVAASAAGIDSELLTAAFDQARLGMEGAQGTMMLSATGLTMLDGSYLTNRQQMGMHAQLQQFENAMTIATLDATQMQTFTDARTALQDSSLQAHQDYQLIFANPDNLPDQVTIDQAQADFNAAMQMAIDNFTQATAATDVQIDNLLDQMAQNMGNGMMGGSLSGTILGMMGFGQMQMAANNGPQNWSSMMTAGFNMADNLTAIDYIPQTDSLMAELAALTPPNMPAVPDWTALPDDATRSLLQLQFDLTLTTMIEHQQQANLNGSMTSLEQAQIGNQHMTNRQNIRQGLQGITAPQSDAMMASMSGIHII